MTKKDMSVLTVRVDSSINLKVNFVAMLLNKTKSKLVEDLLFDGLRPYSHQLNRFKKLKKK